MMPANLSDRQFEHIFPPGSHRTYASVRLKLALASLRASLAAASLFFTFIIVKARAASEPLLRTLPSDFYSDFLGPETMDSEVALHSARLGLRPVI